MSDADWELIAGRNAFSNANYIKVNGKPYVFGELAQKHGVNITRTGADRYERGYYGVLLAGTMARLFDTDVGDVTVFASHPPSDRQYYRELIQALKGRWLVEANGDKFDFLVADVRTYDEPVGGLMNLLIDDEGYEVEEYSQGDTLVIDIGGGTTSVAPCHGPQVDYQRARSFPKGILSVLEQFSIDLRNRYHDEFRRTRQFDLKRLQDALITGRYQAAGYEYPCEYEVDQAKNLLLNEIHQIVQSQGGPASYDNIVLTGGGSGLLERDLRGMLRHGRIVLAEHPDEIHLANVRGGRKMYLALRDAGLL